jgi:hypothetical protein
MSSAPALSFTDRWALVEARLSDENRRATDENKIDQLDALMTAVDDFGWRAELAEEDAEVRRLWCRLREALGAEHARTGD